MGMQMRKCHMKTALLLFTVAALAQPAFAGSSADLFVPTPTPTPGVAPTPHQTQFPTYTPPPPPPTTGGVIQSPTGNASINPSANQGQQSQNSGAGANNAAGAALIAAGMALMANPPTQPAGAALIAMGALALAQGGEDSGAAGQSGNTAAASNYGTGASGTNGNTTAQNPNLGTGTAGLSNPALNQAKQALGDAGYGLTSTGLTTPDGTTIPNSAFNSPGGMTAAGMSPDTVKTVQAALSDVNGKAGSGPKVSGIAVTEGSGGAATPGETGSLSGSLPDYGFKNAFKMSDSARAALLAGKAVNFDGDPIGVRGQNIFEMIHVAYQKKSDRHDFLDDNGRPILSGPAVRAPASVSVKPYVPSKPKPIFPNRNTR